MQRRLRPDIDFGLNRLGLRVVTEPSANETSRAGSYASPVPLLLYRPSAGLNCKLSMALKGGIF